MSENGDWAEGLGDRISRGLAECAAKGITRKEISARLGFETVSSLSKWATGSQVPSTENLASLSAATGISLDYLMLNRKPIMRSVGGAGTRLEIIGTVASEEIDEEGAEKIRQFAQAIAQKRAEDAEALRVDTLGTGPSPEKPNDTPNVGPK